MRSVWSDEIGRIITKVDKISSCVLLTSQYLHRNVSICVYILYMVVRWRLKYTTTWITVDVENSVKQSKDRLRSRKCLNPGNLKFFLCRDSWSAWCDSSRARRDSSSVRHDSCTAWYDFCTTQRHSRGERDGGSFWVALFKDTLGRKS